MIAFLLGPVGRRAWRILWERIKAAEQRYKAVSAALTDIHEAEVKRLKEELDTKIAESLDRHVEQVVFFR